MANYDGKLCTKKMYLHRMQHKFIFHRKQNVITCEEIEFSWLQELHNLQHDRHMGISLGDQSA